MGFVNDYCNEIINDKIKMTRILVIDDEVEMRQAYKTVLEKLDCQVDMANDGIDGLERFLNKIYDVVITEFNLDNLDACKCSSISNKLIQKCPLFFRRAWRMRM